MGDLQCDCKVLSRAHIEGLRYHVLWIHVFATDKHRLDPMKTSRTYALMILTCPVMAEKYWIARMNYRTYWYWILCEYYHLLYGSVLQLNACSNVYMYIYTASCWASRYQWQRTSFRRFIYFIFRLGSLVFIELFFGMCRVLLRKCVELQLTGTCRTAQHWRPRIFLECFYLCYHHAY